MKMAYLKLFNQLTPTLDGTNMSNKYSITEKHGRAATGEHRTCRKASSVQDFLNVAQLGRASRLGREGRRFKSCHSDQFNP